MVILSTGQMEVGAGGQKSGGANKQYLEALIG